ncbi:MAG: glycogen debranching protein [Terriglobia bacterium]|nr:MAG: glycogen debranching protein [Terriglobia bacterium]
MIQFDETVCRNFEVSSRREWLETNGLGGFSSSTVAGLNTRRYHGLLVAATRPPVGRVVLLSKFEEILVVDGRPYELSANRYPGTIHPEGHRYLKSFRLDPFPVFVYEMDGCELEKSIFMVDGENTTVIRYELRAPATVGCSLELRPLIAFRDYHSTTHENGALDPTLDVQPGSVKITPYQGLPPLFLAHNAAAVEPAGYWYRRFEYDRERERGLEFQEDLFNPCKLTFSISAAKPADVIASVERRSVDAAGACREREMSRRSTAAAGQNGNGFLKVLNAAADQFLVRRGDRATVIAGYHWFSDWGRDTMIALPGLTLARGKAGLARSILLEFARRVDRGMLPNRFPDGGEQPEYNTVDATLWFFEAIRALVQKIGDYEFVKFNFYAVLADIVAWHERGTRYGIRLDSDGLLHAGEPGVQLTWMDAKVGDWVVTPRHGKPVEIQALWYNALRFMEELSREFGCGDAARRYSEMAERAKESFTRQFWNQPGGCLFDVVDGDRRDPSIRPNQIFAVSLHHRMLSPEQERSIVGVVGRELLTPYGLRSLAPGDPQYQGRYEGDPASRDSRYHQGTAWPWLLGPFIRAYLRVNGYAPGAKQQAAQWISELQRYVENEGLGQIPEVFDGDAPHRPGGCIAQAWSVAELLRTCVEDLASPALPKSVRARKSPRPALGVSA